MPSRYHKAGPVEAARDCICFNLRKAARAVTQAYDAGLEPSGLRVTQFSILVGLSLGERFPMTQFADALVMDRTTLTRNLRPLEGRGLVRIEQGLDRRERYIALTDAGREALDRALPLWRTAQARALKRVGDAQWSALRGGLAALTAVMHKTKHAS